MPRLLALAAALTLISGACSSTQGVAVIASSPDTIEAGSPQRVLLALATEEPRLRGGPDLEVTAQFRRGGETQQVKTEWVWAIPNARGFYVANPTFPRAGTWELVLIPEDAPPTPPTPFTVVEDSSVPGIGDPAPGSETRTMTDHALANITTDPEPHPSFYELSVAEAVSNGRPSVIVFATPAFCQTATCGPTLDIVKSVVAEFPGLDTVHVEIYENIGATSQGELTEVSAVLEWGLRSEPWVFVVDADGIITARFEGTIGPDELRRALGAVAG